MKNCARYSQGCSRSRSVCCAAVVSADSDADADGDSASAFASTCASLYIAKSYSQSDLTMTDFLN